MGGHVSKLKKLRSMQAQLEQVKQKRLETEANNVLYKKISEQKAKALDEHKLKIIKKSRKDLEEMNRIVNEQVDEAIQKKF